MQGEVKSKKANILIIIALVVVALGIIGHITPKTIAKDVTDEYNAYMLKTYTILSDVEKDGDVYILYVDNKFNLYKKEQKQYFAQDALTALQRLLDGEPTSLMIYDQNNNLVAKSKLDGTITIKE